MPPFCPQNCAVQICHIKNRLLDSPAAKIRVRWQWVKSKTNLKAFPGAGETEVPAKEEKARDEPRSLLIAPSSNYYTTRTWLFINLHNSPSIVMLIAKCEAFSHAISIDSLESV